MLYIEFPVFPPFPHCKGRSKMSDDIPRNDPWPEDAMDDIFDLDEEAVEDVLPEEPLDDWDGSTDEFLLGEELVDEDVDLDASFYEPPEPPVTDAQLEAEEPPEDDDNWFRANWWRLLIIVILVAVIIFLLVRACGGKEEKTASGPTPAPTRVLLSTFTPTPASQLAAPEESGSQAPTGGGLEGETTASPIAQPTAAPTHPPAPTPAPATGGKFSIDQVVVVTGTGRDKLSFRAGPGTKYERLGVIKDGVKLTVVGGPKDANGHTWWRLKTANGQVGWAVEDYLAPVQ